MNSETLTTDQVSKTKLHKGILIFVCGVVMMIGMIFIGYNIDDDLRAVGMKVLEEQKDPLMGLILLFAFGFPLGLVITFLGALMISQSKRKSIIIFFVIGFTLVILAGLVPAIFGNHMSSSYFGTGGLMIMALMIINFWYWAQYRATLKIDERKSTDLKALGYICFGFAAWNTCGLASMPSFTLTPELMMSQGMLPFAIGQAKAIMAYFVLGWLFTAIGMYYKASSNT